MKIKEQGQLENKNVICTEIEIMPRILRFLNFPLMLSKIPAKGRRDNVRDKSQ